MVTESKIEIRAYSKQELAHLYNIGVKSMSSWLKPFDKCIGKRIGRYYTPKQVKVIFEKLGLPGE